MTTAEFWQNLSFASVTTYSFNRGRKLERWQQAVDAEYKFLKTQLLSVSGKQLILLRSRLRHLERAVFTELISRPLLDEAGAFHVTASPVSELSFTNQEKIGQLLRRPILEQFDWMFAPVYRDALVFHDQHGTVVNVLNICFECERMLVGHNQEIAADHSVFIDLKNLLKSLGHCIKDDE